MVEAGDLLNNQLRGLNRVVLTHGGKVSHPDAERRAKSQYLIFDKQRKADRVAKADAELAALKAADKALPKTRRPKT